VKSFITEAGCIGSLGRCDTSTGPGSTGSTITDTASCGTLRARERLLYRFGESHGLRQA
jgi:hypothetical protein